MTEGDPSPSVIQAALNSCYRAGWPTPEELVAKEHAFEDESIDSFTERIEALSEVHTVRMVDIVVWAKENGMLEHVFRTGKLAKENLASAMYILGFTEER